MKHYVGLDVALKETAICIVDDQRRIVREGKAATEPESISAFLSVTGVHRIGHQAHCPFARRRRMFERQSEGLPGIPPPAP